MLMELTPGQRAEIRRLLEEELRESLRALSPADAAALVADRRRALAAAQPDEEPET